jgi:hypothetical protein
MFILCVVVRFVEADVFGMSWLICSPTGPGMLCNGKRLWQSEMVIQERKKTMPNSMSAD